MKINKGQEVASCIQKAARWGVKLFERNHFSLSSLEREECLGMATLKICEVIRKKTNESQKYYEVVAFNAIRNYFRKKRIKELSIIEEIDSLYLDDCQTSTLFWLDDRRLEKVGDLLKKSRIKGGTRAEEALHQELMVLAHVFDGWSTPLIAEEVGISQDAVKKIRIRIIKRLQKVAEKPESSPLPPKG